MVLLLSPLVIGLQTLKEWFLPDTSTIFASLFHSVQSDASTFAFIKVSCVSVG